MAAGAPGGGRSDAGRLEPTLRGMLEEEAYGVLTAPASDLAADQYRWLRDASARLLEKKNR